MAVDMNKLVNLDRLKEFQTSENASTSSEFSTSKSYAAGAYVYYKGKLYKFKSAHAAGAWTTTDVEEAKLADDVSSLKESIIQDTGIEKIEFLRGYVIFINGDPLDITPVARNGWKCASVPCSSGDLFTISGQGGNANMPLYAFIGGSNNIIESFFVNYESERLFVKAPDGATRLIINTGSPSASNLGALSYKGYFDLSKAVDDAYASNEQLSEKVENITDKELCSIKEDGFYRLNVTTVDLSNIGSGTYYHAAFNCESGDRFIISGGSYGGAACLYAFIDKDNNVLEVADTSASFNNYLLIAPNNSTKLLVNDYYGTAVTVDRVTLYRFSPVVNYINKNVATLLHNLTVENIVIPSTDPTGDKKNLCFVCGKWINSNGIVPDYTGYLFFDDTTQKFYYSNGTPYNPQFLFDWDSALSNGEHCKYWAATITKDGDIIFLRDHARANPIVYPHGDYSNPYIVDFGSSKKPYGWLMSSSVIQFDDGSFVFGDYAYHSQQDEANDDRRIIWKVTKPYSNPANWVQAHSFKHVYFTSSKSDEPDNEIGHIHAIMYDFYADDLYCTTGDIDRHCRMWISTDHGTTWAAVPGAVGTTADTTASEDGQKWRMTNSIFMKDAMYWATDAAKPYHRVWKCTRDANGHVDFTTLAEVIDLEKPVLPNNYSQRTYITALIRDPDGLLFLDRGEPRPDKLDIKFYCFKDKELYTLKTFDRASTDASSLDTNDRIGLPQECTTIYQPQSIDGVVMGGSTVIRPNNTGIFNNSVDNYVGALKVKVT